MKILYLHQYFTTPEMSGGTRSFELAKRLVQMGHEVNMITSDRNAKLTSGKGWVQTEESGINVHWFSVPYSNQMSYRRRIMAFMEFAHRSAMKGADIESDVVFASSTPLTIALPAVYTSKKTGVPMVFEIRDLWPEIPISIGALKNPLAKKMARRLELFAYQNSSRIVTLSPGMKEGVVAKGIPEEHVLVIPNFCNFDLFSDDKNQAHELRNTNDWLKDRPLVIYTGAIGLINGIDYMVRLAAAARTLNSDIRFLVIGNGREEENVKRLAKDLGVFNYNFFIKPRVAKSQIPSWLSAADIATSFVIDNKVLWDNSANKFFDALAAGKPIAINYHGWQAEMLLGDNAGLVLDVNDVESGARQLTKAIEDKNWMIEAGFASRSLGEKYFNCDKLAKKLEAVLLYVLSQ